MKIFNGEEFVSLEEERLYSDDSKLRLGARMDLKLTDRIHKHKKSLRDASIKDYEETLKRNDLTDKERKSLESLIGNLQYLNEEMSEDEYIKKFPLTAKKKYRNFSEVEDERLYSTGDDELDDLLEKAFCDGYEYAQKEFGAPLSKLESKQLLKYLGEGNYSKKRQAYQNLPKSLRKELGPKNLMREYRKTGVLPYEEDIAEKLLRK